jgi:hypothetical protein
MKLSFLIRQVPAAYLLFLGSRRTMLTGGDSVNQSLEELKIGGNVVIIGCSKTRISQ